VEKGAIIGEKAIAASNAMKKGRALDKATVTALGKAVSDKAAFDVAFSIASSGGKNVNGPALKAMQLGAKAQPFVDGIKTTVKMSQGGKVNTATIGKGLSIGSKASLSAEIGMAAGLAQVLQKDTVSLMSKPANVNKMAAAGLKLAKSNEILAVGSKKYGKGYNVAIGFMENKINPAALVGIRKTQKGKALLAFDMGLAAYTGMVEKKPIKGASAKQQFGYLTAEGLRDMENTPEKEILVKTITKDPEVKTGVVLTANQSIGLWAKFLRWIGIDGK
jgi:hypothetical protein